jgi:hypothetical protein
MRSSSASSSNQSGMSATLAHTGKPREEMAVGTAGFQRPADQGLILLKAG